MNQKTIKTTFGLLAAGLIGGIASNVVSSFANTTNSTVTDTNNVRLPYSGFISKNSQGIDGARHMEFSVWDSASSSKTLLWKERQMITFYNGRFSAAIGGGTKLSGTKSNIKDAILDADNLYISFTVEDALNSANYITLSGLQRIDAAPFSVWSDHSATLKVGKDILMDDGDILGTDIISGKDDLRIMGSGIAVSQNSHIYISPNGDSTFNGEVVHNGDVDVKTNAIYFDDGDISGVDIIGGKNDLRFYGTVPSDLANPGASDLSLDASGNATFNKNATFNSSVVHNSGVVHNGDVDVKANAIYFDDGDISGVDIVGGKNDLRLYGTVPSDLANPGTPDLFLDSSGNATFDENVTFKGGVRFDGGCPGNQIVSLTSGTSRMCVYEHNSTNLSWHDAAVACWDNYGARLCTYQELTVARIKSINANVQKVDYWLGDRGSDDSGTFTNRGPGSDDNFDGYASVPGTSKDGAFCCRVTHGY